MIHIITHSGKVVFQKLLTTAIVSDPKIALFLQRGLVHDILDVSFNKQEEVFIIHGTVNGNEYLLFISEDETKIVDKDLDRDAWLKAKSMINPEEKDILFRLPDGIDESNRIKAIRSGYFDLEREDD